MYAKPSAASGCAISDYCNVAKKSLLTECPPPPAGVRLELGALGLTVSRGSPGLAQAATA